MYQGTFGTGRTIIGEGSWIGRNACILGRVKLGKNCVVGQVVLLLNLLKVIQ